MTTLYQNFLGVDTGKYEFVVNIYGTKSTKTYTNDQEGIDLFYQDHKAILKEALLVIEVTGGYELDIIRHLQAKSVAVHRASGRVVKNFIRSYGIIAKNDNIDARALSLYAYERSDKLELYKESAYERLKRLQARRSDMVSMRASEKNRAKAPSSIREHESFRAITDTLDRQISLIDQEIAKVIEQDEKLKKKVKIMQSIVGIGKIIATQLITMMPEIGSMNQKQVASLAGVAPHPNQSGKREGYRRSRGGRREIPVILHMAALTAARSKGKLGEFYNRLIENGKAKLVAMTALARKIIVIANARIKEKFYQTS